MELGRSEMKNIPLNTIFLPLVLVIALLIPASAAAADWKIVRMSGDVRVYHNDVTWISLKQDYRLKPGEAVWTGRNGRVMLASASGRLLLKPRSMVRIPVRSSRGSYSVLHQYSGTIEADIDSRKTRHFSVKTPFLAAVVKGTKFTISVKAGASELGEL